jgi:hypothetical protein
MKKFLAFCLALVLVMSMSVTVFAAYGGFVSSPPANSAPELDSFKPADDDCTANIVITPYGDKEELSEFLRQLFEKAYNDILTSDDLTKLNADLAELAKSLNISGTDLAVSELFDLHVTDCDTHEGHFEFEIVLKAESLKNFVGLLHMTTDGKWELIKDAKVLSDGQRLSFSVDSFSPFAIVVDTSGGQTGDNGMVYVYAIIMAVSAVALAVIFVKTKKQKAVA